MSVTSDLIDIVERAHSLGPIIEAASRAIAARFDARGCSIFLLDDAGNLVLSATSEPSTSGELGGAIAAALAAQVTVVKRTAATRGEMASLLACPMLLRDSVLGALVLHAPVSREFSAEEEEALATVSAQLVRIIENARIIDALDRGEQPARRGGTRREPAPPETGERILRGLGASPGVATGPAVFRSRLDLAARDLPAGEAGAERTRVRVAIEKTRNDISRIQEASAREIDEEHSLIFASHLLLLNDPLLLSRIEEQIARGVSAAVAIDSALGDFEARLRLVPDAYIQERVDDVDDLRSRLLGHVLGAGSRTSFGAGIVLTARVPPSLVIELKTEGAQALVTESGGATSHGALLARAMGIPMVTGIGEALRSVTPGDALIVDGTAGLVIVRPSETTVADYAEARRRVEHARTEHAKFRNVLARTADGVRVTLQANVGVASDLAIARENGAEGIGLYRTEFPFIVRASFPTRAEQVKIYGKAYDACPGWPINFRILDLAGDKFVSGAAVAAARSAFHGYRSIRVLLDHPDVLREQVQALALAAGERELRLLIPMVTSMDELRRVKAIIGQSLDALDEPRAQRRPQIGAMIEVPAAVELAFEIATETDFLSIGTNDLMQYTLVVDREDSRMAQLSDPYHPAILRMIARVTAAAHAAGKPVGVCGEIALRPDLALALIALGVDSLSVVPSAIPELKQALAGARLASMQTAISDVLARSDSRSVAAGLRQAQFA